MLFGSRSSLKLPVRINAVGTVKLFGVTGHLFGFCGKKGEVSCSSKKAEFVLTWKKGSDFYNTSSENETRATLVDFSKSLKNA